MTNEHDDLNRREKLRKDAAADPFARRSASFPHEHASRNGVGAEGPGDDYLLTAYLFGDISKAGRDEVERRLEESGETRAEMEKLRSTKALIEDALRGPLEDEGAEAAQGKGIDSHEIAALLRERRRSRRMKMAISWMSIAATVLICGAVILPTLSSGRFGEMTRSAISMHEAAPPESAGDSLAYAPSYFGGAAGDGGGPARPGADDARTTATWGPPDNVGAIRGGGVPRSPDESVTVLNGETEMNRRLERYSYEKPGAKAAADRDGRLALEKKQELETQSGYTLNLRQRAIPETPSEVVRTFQDKVLGKAAAPVDSPEAVELAERTPALRQTRQFEITDLSASEVRAVPEKRAEIQSESARGNSAPGVGITNVSETAPYLPERQAAPDPAKPESEVVSRVGASGLATRNKENRPVDELGPARRIRLPARVRVDDIDSDEAAGNELALAERDQPAVDADEAEADGDYGLLGARRAQELEGLRAQLDDGGASSDESRDRFGRYRAKRPGEPPPEAGGSQLGDESWSRARGQVPTSPRQPQTRQYAQQQGQQAAQPTTEQPTAEHGRRWGLLPPDIADDALPATPERDGFVAGERLVQQAGGELSQQLRSGIEQKLKDIAKGRADDHDRDLYTDSRESTPGAGKGGSEGEWRYGESRGAGAASPSLAESWYDARKSDASAPDLTAAQDPGAFGAPGIQGDLQQLQHDIKTYARRGNQAGPGGGAGGAGGQIVLERASEITDLVNRQQVELFGAAPPPVPDAGEQVELSGRNFNSELAQAGQAGQTESQTFRWHTNSTSHEWLSRLDAGYHNAQREIGPLEKELRAYLYYKSLDSDLTLERYSARPLDVPPPAIGDENLGQDRFRELYKVNPFVDTRHDHFSTFSMDVDTASFTRARERIRSGELPDPASVRVEEFVNYFPQDCAPDPEAAFSVCTEGGPAPFGTGLDLLKITVKARELRPNERKGAVLTFAIDTSGSMHMQNSLDLMRDALKGLVESLRVDDQVAIVAYSANAYVALPHTPAREKERIFAALDSLKAGGGTNVEGGLDLAYRLADEVLQPKAVNRVIVCSDGVANVGARDPQEVIEKVKVFARRGIYLSVVGFGKKRYNDSFLESLAGQGNGNYTYVANPGEARAVFQKNLPATLQVLAEDAKIQVDFDPDVVAHYRLLGYENRDIADKDFRNDKVDAAEVGPGTTVTVLYELHRRPGSHGDLGRLFIRFRDTGTRRIDELDFSLPPGVLETRIEDTSPEFQFTACAAETAEILRGSYWARDGSLGDVLDRLYGLEESFRARPQWRELAQLVTEAQRLLVIRVASSLENDQTPMTKSQ